jgi:hypothetical protein
MRVDDKALAWILPVFVVQTKDELEQRNVLCQNVISDLHYQFVMVR